MSLVAKRLNGQLNGCYNRRPFRDTGEVQAGWKEQPLSLTDRTRIPVIDTVPFRMAYDCQYTLTELGQQDKGCEGCKWRKAA